MSKNGKKQGGIILKKYNKIIGLLLAVALLLPGMATKVSAAENDVTRLAGDNRIETSIKISKDAYVDGSATEVVLAGWEGKADALTGTYLASAKKAPLLFTRDSSVEANLLAELKRLGAKTVYVLGGTTVIKDSVVTALETAGMTVVRVNGENRFETAGAVAKKANATAKHVFLANGWGDLTDALAAGPASAKEGMPVLLTETNALRTETVAAMKNLGVEKVTILGGVNAVSKAIEDKLVADLGSANVNRVSGDNRFATANAIAAKYFVGATKAIVANSEGMPDALVAGYFGALRNAPILLTPAATLHATTAAYLEANVNEAYIVGGTAAVNAKVETDVKTAITPVDAAVVSVSAINLKEVKVTFNQEVDKDSAEDAANYPGSTGTPKLQEDNKTVIFTYTTAKGNQTKADFVVEKIKSADKTKIIAKFTEKDLYFFDNVVPVAEKVEVTGPKQLKVTFSEPMQTAPIFKLNNGSYSTSHSFSAGQKEIVLTLGAVLPTGTHDLEVSGGTDYANFALVKTNLAFNYTPDTKAPTATVDKATETVVILKFDKAVKATGLNTDVTAYHTLNNSLAYKGVLAAVNPVNGYAEKYTVTFSTPIPEGTSKMLFLNTKADKLEDLWGNDVASTTLSFSLVSDVTAPSVIKAEATGKNNTAQKEITLTFDEEVNAADAVNKANYVMKDASGNVIKTVDFADVDNNGKPNANVTLSYNNTKKEVKLSFTSVIKAGTYKLEVSNIKDTSFAQNKLTSQTVNVIVEDKIAPTVLSANSTSADVVYVNFSEAMNTVGLTDVNNYRFKTNGALPSGTTIEVIKNNQVKITLPSGHGLSGTDTVQVNGSLKDLAGNAIGGFYAETPSFTFGTPTAFTISPASNDVKLIAANQLQFEVDTELSAIDVSKFSFTDGTSNANVGVTVTSATYVNNNGKAKVTITLSADLKATDVIATNIGSLVVNADGLTNSVGTKISGTTTFVAPTHFEDKVAAKVIKVETTAANEIKLTFSEDLKAGDVSNLTFSVADNTVASVNNTTANEVILTLGTNIDLDATPKVTQNLDIRDANGNVLVAGTKVVDTVDKIVPVVYGANENSSAKVITLTFSKALDAATVKQANFAGTAGAPTVAYTAGSKTVTLSYDTALDSGNTIIAKADIKDVAGNALVETTFTRGNEVAGSGVYAK